MAGRSTGTTENKDGAALRESMDQKITVLLGPSSTSEDGMKAQEALCWCHDWSWQPELLAPRAPVPGFQEFVILSLEMAVSVPREKVDSE